MRAIRPSMQRLTLTIFVMVLAVLVAMRFFSSPDQPASEPSVQRPPSAAEPPTATADEPAGEQPSDSRGIEIESPGFGDTGCFSVAQLETHPAVYEEMHRLGRLLSNGDFLEPLRGASAEFLEQLAIQGDTAAMVTLGAAAELRALGNNSDDPVDLLNFDLPGGILRPELPLNEAAETHYREAASWYYEAALRGRVMALQNYGRVLDHLEGGPVGLGWATQEDYQAMNSRRKSALLPDNLYAKLASRVAPGLDSGLGAMFPAMIPWSKQQDEIIAKLYAEFETRRVSKNLPPISVPESTFWSEEELLDLICEGDKARLQ